MASTVIKPDFHVALSFAAEDRRYAERVANALREMGLRVFYDKHEVASLWGKDLYTHLRDVYTSRAMYTVMFISKLYREKLWTNHEQESAQAEPLKKSENIFFRLGLTTRKSLDCYAQLITST